MVLCYNLCVLIQTIYGVGIEPIFTKGQIVLNSLKG